MRKKYAYMAAILLAFLAASVAFEILYAVPQLVHGAMEQRPGAYAPLYLYQYSPYDRIVLEVHCEQGITPNAPALAHLQELLENYTGRPVDLYTFRDINASDVPWMADENNISAFGSSFLQEHARFHTGWLGGNATIYVLYVNAQGPLLHENGTSSIAGVTYCADAFLLFKNNVRGAGLERTVLVHETGHLLGLDHDNDSGCAMVASLTQNRSIVQGLVSPPDDYCARHRAQLENERYHLILGDGGQVVI